MGPQDEDADTVDASMGTGVFKLTQRTVEAAKCPARSQRQIAVRWRVARVRAARDGRGLPDISRPVFDPDRQAPGGARCLRRSHGRGSAAKGPSRCWASQRTGAIRSWSARRRPQRCTEGKGRSRILIQCARGRRMGEGTGGGPAPIISARSGGVPQGATYRHGSTAQPAALLLSDAVRAVDRIKAEKGTVAANRTLSYARAAYGWAVKRQHVAVNPLKGIERAGREAPRERVSVRNRVGSDLARRAMR